MLAGPAEYLGILLVLRGWVVAGAADWVGASWLGLVVFSGWVLVSGMFGCEFIQVREWEEGEREREEMRGGLELRPATPSALEKLTPAIVPDAGSRCWRHSNASTSVLPTIALCLLALGLSSASPALLPRPASPGPTSPATPLLSVGSVSRSEE